MQAIPKKPISPWKLARLTTPVVTPADAKVLEAHDLLTPIKGGYRMISISVIESSIIDHKSSAADSVYKPGNEHYEFPAYMESKATLQWLGLDDSSAKELWTTWKEIPIEFPDSFLQFAENWIHYSHHDVEKPEDDWPECLEALGIAEELEDIILSPEFEDLRYRKTARQWVIETFGIRYRGLECINKASQRRAKARAERDDPERRKYNERSLKCYAAGFTKKKKGKEKSPVTCWDSIWGRWVMGMDMHLLFCEPPMPLEGILELEGDFFGTKKEKRRVGRRSTKEVHFREEGEGKVGMSGGGTSERGGEGLVSEVRIVRSSV
ncbi:MAG: hypothetical protein MMC33_010504 [Icmadophila ericetorum]|nr:hypothetical protein [Icmadophila ericetorum]